MRPASPGIVLERYNGYNGDGGCDGIRDYNGDGDGVMAMVIVLVMIAMAMTTTTTTTTKVAMVVMMLIVLRVSCTLDSTGARLIQCSLYLDTANCLSSISLSFYPRMCYARGEMRCPVPVG